MAQKMSFHQSLRILAFCTAATGCFLSSVTLAQTAAQPPLMPPEVKLLDENGVNLMSGQVQYTGQAWLPELGMYHYKARMYSPTLGRFMQTDPIGYDDGINWYAYVANDPINLTDPTGTCAGPLIIPCGIAAEEAIVGITTVAVGVCITSGACEAASDAIQQGIEWVGDQLPDTSPGIEPAPSGPTKSEARKDGSSSPADKRTPVPGTGKRAGDVTKAGVRPGQRGAPTAGSKVKKSDGPKEATRGGRLGGVQGSRTQGRGFGKGKGGDGRVDPEGHKGGPGHNHPPQTEGTPKKGHWWWPF